VVVNTEWLGDQIEQRFADWPQQQPGAEIAFSREGQDFGYALETAGGISRALPQLGEVFWVLAGDVFAPDFAFTQDSVARFVDSGTWPISGWCPTRRTTPVATLASAPMAGAEPGRRTIHLQHHRPVPACAV
jgi:hypothetical protein